MSLTPVTLVARDRPRTRVRCAAALVLYGGASGAHLRTRRTTIQQTQEPRRCETSYKPQAMRMSARHILSNQIQ
ncbi:hypothetical protein KDH_65220 [Dictyobacter sp. S3.2.2.5]|uniref:Secreted protein n=1 Tax=Dictyobacter halimunensis TaxID=3026934 RepID=A0ABQ6G1G6_9CHLR|nr:hypothetical protein KDH_65220 [Dictyobacter sp. S3.2.2.5]